VCIANKFNTNFTDYRVKKQIQYLIGIDGGGTGTRALLVDVNSIDVTLGRGSSGPSGLMHGADAAWQAIQVAIKQAFTAAGLTLPPLNQIAIGCGLAGVNNKQWAHEFVQKNPGFAQLEVETDAGTTLLGAHQGQAGAIIALGTGSVGEVVMPDGTRREVGGWGFPTSDEASGAWLGLRAANHLEQVLDGRAPADELSAELVNFFKSDPAYARDALFQWLANANQTSFAQLAPLVILHAEQAGKSNEIMLAAGLEVAKMALALDPSEQMPLALCGGLSEVMKAYLPEKLRKRVIKPKADAATGALFLIKNSLLNTQARINGADENSGL
jgi:glucosamine kinase